MARYNPDDWADTPENELCLAPMAYPNFGLYMPIAESEAAYPAILDMPIEQQMLYADAISLRYARNPHFLKLMRGGLNLSDAELEAVANSTAVGNMACLAHYNGQNSIWAVAYAHYMEVWKRRR